MLILKNKKIKARYWVLFSILCFLILLVFIVPHNLVKKNGPYSYAVYDKNGVLIGASVATDEQWRFKPGQVPEKFKKAIITYEDKRYYWHFGVDLISIGRAVIYNHKAGRIVSGGSTITMQTVRIMEHNPKRTIKQKIHEAFISVLLEIRYSKKKILELYTSCAPFGGNVVGLEAASWRYFHRSPQDLTWAEAATLAVLPNQPSLVFPGSNKDILRDKRNALLYKLYENGTIDEETYSLSLEERIPEKPYPLPNYAPHYLEYLKRNNRKEVQFYSTLDSTIQINTQRILESWSDKFALRGINNAAAIIIDTKTGDVLAYCGNTGFYNGNTRNKNNFAVDVIQSRRSSGSLLKPFLYCAMMDNGLLLQHQLVTDIPTRIGNYKPDNNVPVYRGAVPADEALTRSLNIPAIRELREYGINAFLAYLRSCGFTTFTRPSEDYGLPLILGGGEITLWEATKAYASMMCKANQQKSTFPGTIGASYLTIDTLQYGIRPDDEAMWQSYANSKKIAWKTGTSNGNRDAWAIGTTVEYTIGVWVGNAEGQGTKELTSVGTSAPVLFDLFSFLPQTTWPEKPRMELEYVNVCKKSGYLAGPYCEETETILRPKEAPVSKVCPYCKSLTFTPDYKYQANVEDMKFEYEGCLPVSKNYFVLPPTLEYYYTKHNIGYKKLPDYVPWHVHADENNIEIVFPQPGANIVIPVEIDGSKGSVVCEASIRDKSMEIFWDLDGEYQGSTSQIHQILISPKPGRHVLTITDSIGTVKTRVFYVIEPGL